MNSDSSNQTTVEQPNAVAGLMDTILQVERWPDRKRKVLSKVVGNQSTVLATFASDKAAASFLDIINDRLILAYQLGRLAGLEEHRHV